MYVNIYIYIYLYAYAHIYIYIYKRIYLILHLVMKFGTGTEGGIRIPRLGTPELHRLAMKGTDSLPEGLSILEDPAKSGGSSK